MKLVRKRVVSLVMAFAMVFSLFAGTGNLSATEESNGESGADSDKILGATPTDAEGESTEIEEDVNGIITFTKKKPSVADESCNMAGMVYNIYKDADCTEKIESLVLSYDGHVYRDQNKDLIYKDQGERGFPDEQIKDREYQLELPTSTYYYRLDENLSHSSESFSTTGYSYSNQIGSFTLTSDNTPLCVICKDEWQLAEKEVVTATPGDADETTEELSEEDLSSEETTESTTEDVTEDVTTESTTENVIEEKTEEVTTEKDIATKTDSDEKPVIITNAFEFITEMLQTTFLASVADIGADIAPAHNWYYDDWIDEMERTHAGEFDGSYDFYGSYYACAKWVWDRYLSSTTVGEGSCLHPSNTSSTGSIKAALDADSKHWKAVTTINGGSTSGAASDLMGKIKDGTVQAGDVLIFIYKGDTTHTGILSAEHRDDDGSLGIWQSNGASGNSRTGLGKLYYTIVGDGSSSSQLADTIVVYRKKPNEGSVSIKKTLNKKVDAATEGIVFKLYKVTDVNSEYNSAGSVKIGEFKVNASGVGIPQNLTTVATEYGVTISGNSIVNLSYGTYLVEEDGATLGANMTKAKHQYVTLTENHKTEKFTFDNTTTDYPDVRLVKVSSNEDMPALDEYNMAGITYKFFEAKNYDKAVSSYTGVKDGDNHVSVKKIVVSYNGKAYMDKAGKNIVFTSKDAKAAYKAKYGESSIKEFSFFLGDSYMGKTIYAIESATLLNTGEANHYYYNENGNKSYADAGAAVKDTGFKLDQTWHTIQIPDREHAKTVSVEVEDEPMLGKVQVSKKINGGDTSLANGVTVWLERKNDKNEWVHVGTFKMNKKGNGIPVSVTKSGKNLGIKTNYSGDDIQTASNRYLFDLPFGSYRVRENNTQGLKVESPKNGTYTFTIGTDNFTDGGTFKGNLTGATGTDQMLFTFINSVPVAYTLQKSSTIPAATADTDYYNMAGIKYGVYDSTKSKTVKSEPIAVGDVTTVSDNRFVLSYDGKAYMDNKGVNVVFVSKDAKAAFRSKYGTDALHIFRWATTDSDANYYVKESKTLLDKADHSKDSTRAYYYDDGTKETKALINKHSGGSVKEVTGFIVDDTFHKLNSSNGNLITNTETGSKRSEVAFTTSDSYVSGKGKAKKNYSGAAAELKGIKFYLYKIPNQNSAINQGELIGTFIHDGTKVVPESVSKTYGEPLGIRKGTGADADYIVNLPFGWYKLVEDASTTTNKGFTTVTSNAMEINQNQMTIEFTLTNTRSELSLKKVFDNTPMNTLCSYSLKGAEYKAYIVSGNNTKDTTNYIATFVTDEDGNGYVTDYKSGKNYTLAGTKNGHSYILRGIPVGSWIYLTETKTSNGCNKAPDQWKQVTTSGMKAEFTSVEPLKNDPISIQIKKEDSETDEKDTSRTDSGAASLAGAEFTVKFYDVDVSGTVNKDTIYNQIKTMTPERTWVYMTDENGEVKLDSPSYLNKDKSNDPYLTKKGALTFPYGAITIEETKAPEGYTTTGEFTTTDGKDKSMSDGKIFAIINDDYSVEKFVGTNSLIKKEVILRADLKFKKIALDTNEPLSGIAFKITSKTTGESHVVVTDDDGMIDTSNIKHSENTNAADSDYKTIGGTWFYGNKDEKGKIKDELGALPFDTYEITELATEVNKDYRLITPITVDLTDSGMYADGYQLYDLGTVTNVPEPSIGTRALGVDTEDNIVPANTKVNVKDICDYRYFESGKTYTIKGIIMNPETKKPFIQKDGSYSLGHKTFTVASDPTGYKCDKEEIPYIIDTTGIEGKDVVVAEYVYEGEDDSDLVVNPDGSIDTIGVLVTHTGKMVVHDDLTSKTQTLSVPKIGTTALGVETETHYLHASGIQKFKDIVNYTNVVPNRTYDLEAVAMDQETGKPILDVDGNVITATAKFTPKDKNGSAEVYFTCDTSKVDFTDKAIVLFEDLYYNKVHLTAHADITDEGQTLYFPHVTSILSESGTDSKNPYYSTDMKLTDTVTLTNMKAAKVTDSDTTVTIKDVFYNKRTKKPVKLNGKDLEKSISVSVTSDTISSTLDFAFDGTKTDLYKDGDVADIVAFVYVYDEKGNLIAKEEDLDNQNQSITFDHPTTSVQVKKEWKDSDDTDGIRPESIKVQLYKDETVKVGAAVTLSEKNNWSYNWSELPAWENCKEIDYTVKEVDIPDGYTCKITEKTSTVSAEDKKVHHTAEITKTYDEKEDRYIVKSVGSSAKVAKMVSIKEFSYTITNTHKPGTTNIKVIKHWKDSNDGDGIRPETIKVQLYKNGTTKVGDEVTLSEKNGWTYTWEDLARTENGAEISYSVDEVSIPDGYTKKVTNDGTVFTITNTHTSKMTGVKVIKIWEDNEDSDGIRPETIKVQLYKNGSPLGDAVMLSENNNWSYHWSNLPKEEDGKAIVYTVDEVSIPDGYTKTVTKDGTAFTIANTHKPGTTSVKVTKVWKDSNDKYQTRPKSITVQLYMGEGDGKIKVGDAITLNESMNWTYTWDNLEKLEDGKEIVYTVDEVNVPDGYTKTVTKDDQASITSYIITNTRPDKPHTPKTGDTFHMIPVFILFGMSLAAIIVILIKKRRK